MNQRCFLKIAGILTFLGAQPALAIDFSDPSVHPYLHFLHDNDFTGNDFGFTGQIDAEVGVVQDDGWSYSVGFNTTLYSERELRYGDPAHPQFQPFTDYQHYPAGYIPEAKGTQNEKIEQDSVLSGRVGHAISDSPFSWSLEAGFTQTESNVGYIPGAGGWQQAFHHLISATTYNIISDGKGPRYGAFVKPMGRLEWRLDQKDSIAIMPHSDFGVSVDTEGRRTFLLLSAGTKLGIQENNSRAGRFLELDSSLETQLSATHKQGVLREFLNFNFEHTTVFTGVSVLLTRMGYANFFETNYVDQDPIIRIGFTTWFNQNK